MISLGQAAEILGISRFELMERFERLRIPLRIGTLDLAEARDEVRAARSARGGLGPRKEIVIPFETD